MSKQKGVIKLEGTMGGIAFYLSDGEYLARTANGPSKEKIDTDPAFRRTRENNTEFGGSSRAAKAFRLALGGVLQTMAGSRLVSRLTAIFKRINLKGTGRRGQRPIDLSTNRELLANFNFNRNISFSSVFNAPYTVTAGVDRNEANLSVDAFNPGDFINAPSGATHFRLVNVLGVVSDYSFDTDSATYEPDAPSENGLNATVYSATLPLDATTTAISLDAVLSGAPTIPTDATAVQCIGIEFFQEVDGDFYLFAQDNAMQVASLF